MSLSNSSNSAKRKLIKESPLRALTARTEELTQVSLKEAYLINIDLVELNPNQPRKFVDPLRLQELSNDIKARGILQPPIVRRTEGDKYQLIVGERRYRAAQMAGLKEIPVLVRDLNDQDAQIVSLIENIQREDLDIGDEAKYFKLLQEQYDFSIRDIAALINKSKSYVESRLRLLNNSKLLGEVQDGKIGVHEAVLLSRLDEDEQKSVREKDSPKSVREKDSYEGLTPTAYSFVRHCRRLFDLSHNMAARLEKMTTENERTIILETLNELELELGKLQQRLQKYAGHE